MSSRSGTMPSDGHAGLVRSFADVPVIVGVGEASERLTDPGYAALSPLELASVAAQAALADAGAAALAAHIDVIAAVPQFEVSGPYGKPPFGASNNFARSVGRRIGADPKRAILEVVGGQAPQHLVNECAEAIACGEMGTALLVGAEALSTVRDLQSRGETRDWSEHVEGRLEHRGHGLDGLVAPELLAHGARAPVHLYALFENARRAARRQTRAEYTNAMAELFALFTRVAAANPHAMSHEIFSAADLAAVTERNRLVADPYPRRMVSRDQVNQGAAVLMTSQRRALQAGVPQARLIYLHGAADVQERSVLDRADLSRSPAAASAVHAALSAALLSMAEIDFLDLYSCFPIAVFNVCDVFELPTNGQRTLTVTGGLPFFGGAGSNYSMHAIASMVRLLRERPGARGLIGANGGFLSKYSVGVYSTFPGYAAAENPSLQAEIDGWAAPGTDFAFAGEAAIETYTIDHAHRPPRAVVIARTQAGNRTVGSTDNPDIVASMIAHNPLGGSITLTRTDPGPTAIASFRPITLKGAA